MKKVEIILITAVLSTAFILGLHLVFNGFKFAEIDIQRLVVDTIRFDVILYLVSYFTNNDKAKAVEQ